MIVNNDISLILHVSKVKHFYSTASKQLNNVFLINNIMTKEIKTNKTIKLVSKI